MTGNTAIDALKTTADENYSNEIIDSLGDDRLVLIADAIIAYMKRK